MNKDYEEGEESPQMWVAPKQERKSSQSPLNDAELNEQSPTLHKPSYFQQSQPKNVSQSYQQCKKQTAQCSHSQQFSHQQAHGAQQYQQQNNSQQKSSSPSPGLHHNRTKKQMRKLTNFSLEFQEKEVREFYFQLFEQWPKGIFNLIIAVKVALAGWFTVTEALFFRNVIATVLSVFTCGLLLLLWKVGRKYRNHQLTVFRVAHVVLSFIMYLQIYQLAKNQDEYDSSINLLTSASKISLTAFSSILFSIYQVIAIQLEVKWFFKGILFFLIILQNVMFLMEFDLFSWLYGLIAFTLLLIILYKHEVAKKRSGFRFYRIAEDFDSLKTLINDILPMQIFIVQRSQAVHSTFSATSVNQLSLFKKQRENNKKIKKQAEKLPYIMSTFNSNMAGVLQVADQKDIKDNQVDKSYQRHDTDSPLIKSTRKYEENKVINTKLQIAFANKLMLKDFGTDESTDIMLQLGNIHLPEVNRSQNQQIGLNGQQNQRQGENNLLELLKSKLCRSNQETEMKPFSLNENPQTPTLQFQNHDQASKYLQSQQYISKQKYPFNSPGKFLGIQLSPLYRHRKNMNQQISCDKIDFPNDTDSKSRGDSPIMFSRNQGQLASLLSNNLISEAGTPQNSHHKPPTQPAIQIHPPVQSNYHIDTAQNLEQVQTSQLLKSNLLSASTPQFSKVVEIEQQHQQELNEQKENTQQKSNQSRSNVKIMEEYLNCVHNTNNQGENDSEEKNYDIRLVECRWEGQKSIMVIMNNINERLMRQRLLQIEKYKDTVIDTISHNLKTPLNCILAPLECVKTQFEGQIKIEKSEDQKELFATESLKHVGMAINNCQLLLSMINDLIDYSQIIKGDCSFRLEITHFKLSSVVKVLRMLFEEQMKSKKIDFIITSLVPVNEIVLLHDERRLLQILVNLISNSLKYTFKGKIELIIDNPSKELTSSPLYSHSNSPTSKFKNRIKRLPIQSENILRFVLIDTGIGMSTYNLHQLKNLLFKKKHLASNSKSSGLGLTMCFALIEQIGYQGISPEIQSQEDVGTRFSFTIQQIYKHNSNPKTEQFIRPPLSSMLEKKAQPPHLPSGSVIQTNSPVCQEYQSSSVLGSKQDSFELPKIQHLHQSHQHPSVILSQYNFSHLHTKSTLEHTLRKQSSLENNNNNINNSISKQLEKQIISSPKDPPDCYPISQAIQSKNNNKNNINVEHILESSSSEEEKKEMNLKNITQQVQQQYLIVQPTNVNPKSCGVSYASSINKDHKSILQVEQNCKSNQGTDREIPSRKNSQQYYAKKSIQLQQQSIIFSPSARSELSRDPVSFYSSIAQRHTILFGKERKTSESDNLDENSVVNSEELMQDQPKDNYSTKHLQIPPPPVSPSIYRKYRHHTDQSYGNSCDCVQEEEDDIGQKEDKEKAMSVSLEIRRKPFMTFGNRDLLQVESEFMQRSQDYSNTERVSEEKSHITTQKYNIVQSASKGNGNQSLKIIDSQKSINSNLRWMLPHLQTEQNIDETIEMILAGKHILIVDDTIYNIMMLRILIRNVKDLKIEEAYNGKDAFEKFQTHAINNAFFDFIFMDIEMPIMDGLECIKNIRDFELANDLKPTTIISVTAYDRDLQEVLLAGADGLIAKPIRKDKFLQTLRFLSANNNPKNSSNMILPLSL